MSYPTWRPSAAHCDYEVLALLRSRGVLYESSAAAVATRFLYDGATLIGEYNASGVLQRRYVPGPGVDEPVLWYEGSGTSDRRWLLQDRIGSVIGAADAAGASLAAYAYDEYGRPNAWTGARLRYTGQMMLCGSDQPV